MDDIFLETKVMWSQVDANRHMRHSAYADLAAQARLELLDKMDFSTGVLEQLKIGPVLFREELIYMKELHLNDKVSVSCAISRCREDGSRWSFEQKMFRGDGQQAALIRVDGAWIDLRLRKITALPADVVQRFLAMPRTADFITDPVKTK